MGYGSGDKLARGAASAQFGGAHSKAQDITQFEYDFANMSVDEITVKYGISVADFDLYAAERLEGKPLPDLTPTAEQGTVGVGVDFVIEDKRSSALPESVSLPAVAKKYPEKQFGVFRPVLDRILVKRVEPDENLELLSDGSVKDKRTGFIMPAKYRQHSNTGVVLAIGQFVVMGGTKTSLSEIVKVGDRVTYGDYNSEVAYLHEDIVKQLCDAIQLNYVEDESGTRIVRIQDVRGVEPQLTPEELSMESDRASFIKGYHGITSHPDAKLKDFAEAGEADGIDPERVKIALAGTPEFKVEFKEVSNG